MSGLDKNRQRNCTVCFRATPQEVHMLEHGIEWEQLGTHEEHLSVLDYKKQERAKEVRALDTTIA